MPPSAESAVATATALALTKGPLNGPSGVTTPTNVHCLSENVSVPVGTFATTEYARFGVVPRGARILPSASYLSTDHTATVAGSLVLVPISGTGSNQTIPTVTANLEATETTSVPDAAADVLVAEDSWVQFVPGAATTIATTAKNFRLRLFYALGK